LTEKANKAWGDKVTLTLINGWTGNLYCRKNDLGQVQINGVLTVGTGTGDTAIAVLPNGYYNTETYTVFPGWNAVSGAFPYFKIYPGNGNILLSNTTTTGQSIRINVIIQV
jgi:hypothetical protein